MPHLQRGPFTRRNLGLRCAPTQAMHFWALGPCGLPSQDDALPAVILPRLRCIDAVSRKERGEFVLIADLFFCQGTVKVHH